MNEQPKAPQQPQLTLKLPAELQAAYVNLARITHSPSEIVMDFALILPGGQPAEIQSRVLMSPLSAKLFYNALGDNLAKYEAKFGPIQIPGGTSLAEHLFRPPQK